MATWLLAWVGLPALVLVLCVGLGLLVQKLLRGRLSGVELAGIGFATLIVVTTLVTEFPTTARFAAVATLIIALAGWAVGGIALLDRGVRGWSLAAGGVVYVVYALSAALAGTTWNGFISLDDTADWMAFADRLVTAGHTTAGLAHSTFGRLIDVNWTAGYPVGAFGDLGVVSALLRIDGAWVVHPLMATIAAILAGTLYAMTSGLIASRALRFGIAAVAACSALLYGYVLWGGFKEITMAALLAVACVCVSRGRRDRLSPWAQGALLAIPLAAIYVVFGLAGVAYIGPIAVVQLVVMLRTRGLRQTAFAAATFIAVAAVLSVPALRMLGTQLSQLKTASLTGAQDIGNLYGPLKFWQVVGIWPASDFRLPPEIPLLTGLIIVVTVIAAVLGVVAAIRARQVRPLTYVGVALLVATYSVFGNAWLEGKALAVSSPAVLLAAGLGIGWLVESGRRFEGFGLGALVALGVAASVVLAYGSAWVAPAGRMTELSQIGDSRLPKPALMLEYSPIGSRWFLRNLDAEAAGELRWNLIPMYSGEGLGKGAYADIDEFPITSLAAYPTLVLRTDLATSRPPSSYRLERQGEGYNVWVADPSAPAVLGHWPLGTPDDPAAIAPCETVKAAIAAAGSEGRIAVVRRAPIVAVDLGAGALPPGWSAGPAVGGVTADRPGEVSTTVTLPTGGMYRGTLGGSVFGPVSITVDGTPWTDISTSLNWSGNGTPLPPIDLAAGAHIVTVSYRQGWGPGQAHSPVSFGPLVLSEQGPEAPVEYVSLADAPALCGQRLDWVEAVAR